MSMQLHSENWAVKLVDVPALQDSVDGGLGQADWPGRGSTNKISYHVGRNWAADHGRKKLDDETARSL
jgi:hypothetical protein